MDGGDTVAALRSAFEALTPIAPPARLATVLRHAVLSLLEEETVLEACPVLRHGEVPKHSGSVLTSLRRRRHASQPGLEAWIPLRDRVLAELASSGTSRRELASQLGISLSTLKSVLLPHCRAPGAANLAKLRRWLESRPPAAPQGKSAEPKTNGVGTAESEASPGVTALPAHRLTVSQREKLAGYRELDERAMRKAAGVTLEMVDAAIAGGRDLAPEIVGRLVGFLERQLPGPSLGNGG
jgi:hypothetical protein